MPVIGTAGHVDHGKSTLVLAMTGRDPDRWEEEKRRGLTIDLGFAWTTLSGVEVSFVDVPGHERFIKNMLAGTEGLDLGLLVVAADEGWMPQTEEHLSVLDLLGVDRCVVAVTKTDRVDEEVLGLVMLDIEERLEGTSLEGSPLVPTAAPLGEGLDDLRAALGFAIGELPAAEISAPRLWIDRSFTIAGAGTVVTGTLVGGALQTGQEVEILPAGRRARIRSLQSHERERELVSGSARVAVSLAGIEKAEVGRGMLLTPPGHLLLNDRFTAALRTVRTLAEPIGERGAYHVHMGTGAWPARLRLLEGEDVAEAGHALIEVAGDIPLQVGDRFVLREVGRRAVVAGGSVLDPSPPRRMHATRASLRVLDGILEASPDGKATALLDVRRIASMSTLAAHTGGGQPDAALVASGTALSAEGFRSLETAAIQRVEAFHRDNPLHSGIPKASLASALSLSLPVVEALVDASPELETRGTAVAAVDFEGGLTEDQEKTWEELSAMFLEKGLAPPRTAELSVNSDLLHLLIREGRLVRVSADLVYLPEQLDRVRSEVAQMAQPFTVADFRDLFGITRKYAVPLLEWLDSQGVTQRRGDVRSVRRT